MVRKGFKKTGNQCLHDGCAHDGKIKYGGFCNNHKICKFPGCVNKVSAAGGLCKDHARTIKCCWSGCTNVVRHKKTGLCDRHGNKNVPKCIQDKCHLPALTLKEEPSKDNKCPTHTDHNAEDDVPGDNDSGGQDGEVDTRDDVGGGGDVARVRRALLRDSRKVSAKDDEEGEEEEEGKEEEEEERDDDDDDDLDTGGGNDAFDADDDTPALVPSAIGAHFPLLPGLLMRPERPSTSSLSLDVSGNRSCARNPTDWIEAYNILGVNPDANNAQIRAKFRKLAFKYHPDKNKDSGASGAFIVIREAYNRLMNLSSVIGDTGAKRQSLQHHEPFTVADQFPCAEMADDDDCIELETNGAAKHGTILQPTPPTLLLQTEATVDYSSATSTKNDSVPGDSLPAFLQQAESVRYNLSTSSTSNASADVMPPVSKVNPRTSQKVQKRSVTSWPKKSLLTFMSLLLLLCNWGLTPVQTPKFKPSITSFGQNKICRLECPELRYGWANHLDMFSPFVFEDKGRSNAIQPHIQPPFTLVPASIELQVIEDTLLPRNNTVTPSSYSTPPSISASRDFFTIREIQACVILGVSSTTHPDDIKNTYRKLALQYHPDKNSDIKATEHFIAIRSARDLLLRSANPGVATTRNELHQMPNDVPPPSIEGLMLPLDSVSISTKLSEVYLPSGPIGMVEAPCSLSSIEHKDCSSKKSYVNANKSTRINWALTIPLGNLQDDVQLPSSATAGSVLSTSFYGNMCKIRSGVVYADVLDCSNAEQYNNNYMVYSSEMAKLDRNVFGILERREEMGTGVITDLMFYLRSIVLGFLAIPVLRSSLRKMYGVQVGGCNLHGKVLLEIPFAVWFACAIFGALDIYHADVWNFLGRGSLFFSAAVSFLFVCGVSWKKRDREHQRRLQPSRELADKVAARNIELPKFKRRVEASQRHNDELLRRMV